MEWNKTDCCENCGATDYYTSSEMRISHRRYRLCKKCMKEIVESMEELLNEDDNVIN